MSEDAIFACCHKGRLDIVKQYIDKGGNPNCKDDKEATLLHNACRSSNCELVRYLCEVVDIRTSIKNKFGNTPLHLACLCGSYQIVRYLIDDRNCETNTRNSQGNVPLHLACNQGRLDIVKYIISTGRCDMNARGFEGESLLHAACRGENLELVQYLVKVEGFDIHQRTEDKRRRGALQIASQFSNKAVVQWLVEQGLSPEEGDEDGVTPIHVVSDVNVLRYFLEPKPSGLKCNPNICTLNGGTPLHFAVRYNEQEIAKYLICERECDPMQCDNDGDARPHLAAREGAWTILKFLVESGCDMNSRNKVGETALSLVKYMISTGHCDMTFRAFAGEYLLHAAFRSQDLELVQYFMKVGRFHIHQKTKDNRRKKLFL